MSTERSSLRVERQHSTPLEIQHLAYDWYGARLATVSSDNYVRVYHADGKLSAEWRAHHGTIWKVAWAHPEVGSVIATCAFDRKVIVWEELADAAADAAVPQRPHGGWRAQAELGDARDSVGDIKFAPKAHGSLLLASCSVDRFIRIYEASDMMDVSVWTLSAELDTLAARSIERAGEREQVPQAISWSEDALEGALLAVGMADGTVDVYAASEQRGWSRTLTVERPQQPDVPRPLSAHSDCVNDVAFAPDVGRSYMLLASASRDRTVRLWALEPSSAESDAKLVRLACELPQPSQVWRVEWNAAGTMLAVSTDDGQVLVYAPDGSGGWHRKLTTTGADATHVSRHSYSQADGGLKAVPA